MLGQVEGAFDDVAALVGHGVQRGRPSSGGAFALAGGDLVLLLRITALMPRARSHRRLVPEVYAPGRRSWHPVGYACGQAPGAGRDVGQHLGEHRTVVALPAGDHDRQRSAAAIDRGVDLRRQPATGPADTVTRGFTLTPSGLWTNPSDVGV